ncbi:ParA family protein [Anaerococcus sp. AGMB00486]|uniref:ParA family protein n=2 Tax=Anaerococcus TaxID=165779 RepID=A0ABX2N975_9FIRM|nr:MULTISPECIES: ParA family protein [Anaerococcus]MSS77580.1 ParA family protein [Anaerococcus porci]NVF11252.1 ParA family protein [Anaerococcus faecalis]
MKTISIFNQKGGVGKTTTVVNLATALSKLGKKILVIDFDPQANTTTGLGLDKSKVEKSIYKMFYEEDSFENYIVKTEDGAYLIPSENALSGLEVELVSLDERERLTMLSSIIKEIGDDFDLIIIDCPPSLGLLSLNALVASDSIIIPIQTEYYALEGVSELMNTYKSIKSSVKEDLEIEGVLLCMFDGRCKLSYEVVEEVKSYFKSKVFKTMIPRNIKLAEAPSYGKSVIVYDEKSKGARAYLNLASELIENIKKESKEKENFKKKTKEKISEESKDYNQELRKDEKDKKLQKDEEKNQVIRNDEKNIG